MNFSKLSDPREIHPKPPFPKQKQDKSGTTGELDPKPDHGEETYIGVGRLEGRKALITGGDSGIGRAVALAFAREGADVAINYFEATEDAQETARLIESAGRRAVVLQGDLAEKEDCRRVARQAEEAFGRIDILVNNAAFQKSFEKFEEITDEAFERSYAVNVFGMFRLCQALLPQMLAGGSIINTASIQAFDPSETLVAYASTKSAIVSFTKTLATLAIQQGVRVNAVAPGPVWTPLIPATMPAEKVKTFGVDSAFGRPAQPAELAPLFVFLASNEASYVTGEVFGATGGQMPF